MKTEDEAVAALRRLVDKAESQRAAAERLNVVPSLVSELLKGRRRFSDRMLGKLGLRRREIVEAK